MSWGVKVITIFYWVPTDLKKEKNFFFRSQTKSREVKGSIMPNPTLSAKENLRKQFI